MRRRTRRKMGGCLSSSSREGAREASVTRGCGAEWLWAHPPRERAHHPAGKRTALPRCLSSRRRAGRQSRMALFLSFGEGALTGTGNAASLSGLLWARAR